MVIVRLIKDLLKQKNKTIGYLAKESGLPYIVVENVIKRDITPTPEDAEIMLAVLGVRLIDVLCLY